MPLTPDQAATFVGALVEKSKEKGQRYVCPRVHAQLEAFLGGNVPDPSTLGRAFDPKTTSAIEMHEAFARQAEGMRLFLAAIVDAMGRGIKLGQKRAEHVDVHGWDKPYPPHLVDDALEHVGG